MAVPKRRVSRSKQKSRVMANRWHAPLLKTCPSCGSAVPGHIACPSCGKYGTGENVRVVLADAAI